MDSSKLRGNWRLRKKEIILAKSVSLLFGNDSGGRKTNKLRECCCLLAILGLDTKRPFLLLHLRLGSSRCNSRVTLGVKGMPRRRVFSLQWVPKIPLEMGCLLLGQSFSWYIQKSAGLLRDLGTRFRTNISPIFDPRRGETRFCGKTLSGERGVSK